MVLHSQNDNGLRPWLAADFGLNPGTVRTLPMERWMSDKEPVWERIGEKCQVVRQPMGDVARWDFADFSLGLAHDLCSSMNRARRLGFQDMEATEHMFIRHLDAYRAARILP